jgi:hypothetical protein
LHAFSRVENLSFRGRIVEEVEATSLGVVGDVADDERVAGVRLVAAVRLHDLTTREDVITIMA